MTKRRSYRILSASFVLFAFLPYFAFAAESIDAFTAHIELKPNGSAIVQEEIVYNFGDDAVGKHGIYRKIPLTYNTPGDNTERKIEISSIMVTDGQGNLRMTKTLGGGNYIELKIGEPDMTVSGRQLYVIHYTVWGAINQNLEGKDEFYWNVTGNGWKEGILAVRADVFLPFPLNENKISTACYFGPEGSTAQCTASTTPQEGTGIINSVRYTHDSALGPYEGMSVAVGVPKRIFIIPPPSTTNKLADSVGVYHWWRNAFSTYFGWSIMWPIVTFAVMFELWWTNGRDPKGRGVIIAEFEIPDHLSVLDTAFLLHGSISGTALSASIIELAVRGYLTIERTKKKVLFFDSEDFKLVFTPDADTTLLAKPEFDLYIALHNLSKKNQVLLSSLSHQLTTVSTNITSQVTRSLIEDGYYEKDSLTSRTHYVVAGLLAMLLSFFLPFGNLAFVLSGFIILCFAFIMPKMTERGIITKEHILGFKKYLEVAESDRINFTDAPEKNPALFAKFLPYAILFGVEKKWAEKFADVFTPNTETTWYRGGSAASAVTIGDQLTKFSTSASTAFVSSGGGSGGGGSSGGGGGGGGGGSW